MCLFPPQPQGLVNLSYIAILIVFVGFTLHIVLTFISAHAINEKPQSFHRQYIIYMLTYESWVRSPNRSPDPLDFFFFGGGGGVAHARL